MILMKCLGAALVVISGCGLGLQLAGQWRGRLALLEQLRKMIHLLKGEIVYANSTLEEALCRVGSRTDGGLGKMFSSAGEEISRQTGESLKAIWERQVESLGKDCLLAKEDRKALAELGANLGFLDTDMQERVLLLYLEKLDGEIGGLRGQVREKCRLYTGLGIMAGLFLAVVLV